MRAFLGSDAAAETLGLSECERVRAVLPGLSPIDLVPLVWQRVRTAYRALQSEHAQVLISDGDAPSCLAARLARVPDIAVGHGLVFSHCRRPRGLPAWPWRREAAKSLVASFGSRFQVAVSLVALEPRRRTAIVAAPPLPGDLGSRTGENDGVLCYFRGSDGDQVLQWLVQMGERPIVFAPHAPAVAGIDWRPLDRLSFMTALRRARYVVSSAGSNLIAECGALGVPQLALYPRDHDEQRLNIAMLKDFHVSGAQLEGVQRHVVETFVRSLPSASARSHGPLPWAGLPDVGDVVVDCVKQLVGRPPRP